MAFDNSSVADAPANSSAQNNSRLSFSTSGTDRITPPPEEATPQQQSQSHLIGITSDQPIEAIIRTINIDPAIIVGLEILRRHSRLGTFHNRKKEITLEDGTTKSCRAASSRYAIFVSMCYHWSELKDHFAGVFVKASPEELAEAVGLLPAIAWPALRDLESLKVIKRVWQGRGNHHFEVSMPEISSDDEIVCPSKLGGTNYPSARARTIKDLDNMSLLAERARPSYPENSEPNYQCEKRGDSTGARARTAHDHDHDMTNHDHEPKAHRPGGEDRGELLRKISCVWQGQTLKLDRNGIRRLLQNPKCTVQRIQWATRWLAIRVAQAVKENDLEFSPMGYVYRLCDRGCDEPPTDQELAHKPPDRPKQTVYDKDAAAAAEAARVKTDFIKAEAKRKKEAEEAEASHTPQGPAASTPSAPPAAVDMIVATSPFSNLDPNWKGTLDELLYNFAKTREGQDAAR